MNAGYLLLGFPSDYWSERHIQQAVGTFVRVLLYEADSTFLARPLARARVKDVQKVPQFIVMKTLIQWMVNRG